MAVPWTPRGGRHRHHRHSVVAVTQHTEPIADACPTTFSSRRTSNTYFHAEGTLGGRRRLTSGVHFFTQHKEFMKAAHPTRLAVSMIAGGLAFCALTVTAQSAQQPAPPPAVPNAPAGRGMPQGRGAAPPPLAPAAIERAAIDPGRDAQGDGRRQAHRRQYAGHDRPHAARARRQPRADRIRDQHRAARQIRAQGRSARRRKPADVDRLRRQRRRAVSRSADGGAADLAARGPAAAAPPGGRGRPAPPTPEQLEAQRAARLVDSQAGVRSADARPDRLVARHLSADVRLRGAGGGAAGHGRRARRPWRRQLRAAGCSSPPTPSCRS